jgi:hypothetical protein
MTSTYPGKNGIKSIWSPDKRWSNGRLSFATDEEVYAFCTWLSNEPGVRTFNVGGERFELWAAKEKSSAKRQQDASTGKVANAVRSQLEHWQGWDPAQFDVGYLAQTIWYGRTRVCTRVKGTNRWQVEDLTAPPPAGFNLNPDLVSALQSAVDSATAAAAS